MCGSVAQLVVAPNQRWVRLGLNPIQAGFFFQASFLQLLKLQLTCEDNGFSFICGWSA